MIFSSLFLAVLLLPCFFPAGMELEQFRLDWTRLLIRSIQDQQELARIQEQEEAAADPAEVPGEVKKVREEKPQDAKSPAVKQPLPSRSIGPKKIINPNVGERTTDQQNPQTQKQIQVTPKPAKPAKAAINNSQTAGFELKNEVSKVKQDQPVMPGKLASEPKQANVVGKGKPQDESDSNQVSRAKSKAAAPANKTAALANKAVAPAKKGISEIIEKLDSKDSVGDESAEPVLSSDLTKLKGRIETCLQYYYLKPVNADVLRPWSIMHGVLGYGQNALVTSQGKKINAVDYLCHNGIGNDRKLFLLKDGKLSVAVGTGFQGHEGQLLAILAQVKTPIDHPIKVDGQDFTVRDLVEYEKRTCRAGTELTFKLIGLSAYLPTEEVWKDERGQGWDISRLMYEEMAQPINGAACGGTHRLMGLSYALAVRRARGEPIDGQWKRAESFTESYQKSALTLQNPDGGFSTEFFEGVSHSPDPIRQIYSTGHLLEWLSFSMTKEQLRSPEITKMVNRLLDLMESEYKPRQELTGTDVGPTGHALRALRLYELRLFDCSTDVLKMAEEDQRPLISASEVPAMQKKIRAILPSMTEPANVMSTSNSPSTRGVEGNSSQPNMRGRGIMRRR